MPTKALSSISVTVIGCHAVGYKTTTKTSQRTMGAAMVTTAA